MAPLSGDHTLPAPQPVSAKTVVALWVFVALAVVAVLATAATREQATATLGLVTFALVLTAARRVLLSWPVLLGSVIVVILFIPIRRYTLGGGLPFALEPYRVLIAIVISCWLAAALVDPATRLRATNLEWPILVVGVAIVASLVTNLGRVAALSSPVAKQVTFFASFIAVMYLVASVVDRRSVLDGMIKLLVLGGTLVAILGLVEWYTGANAFNSLERVIPILDFNPGALPPTPLRGGKPRVYASAQHAIAFGAALVLLLPLAVYLFRRTSRIIWMACAGILVMGSLATGPRTAVVMLAVSLVVFLWLKRQATIRLLPYLLPLMIVCQVAMPGTLGTFRATLFPNDGLVAEEYQGEGSGTGRLADVGPSLQEWGQKPLFGKGFGTRLTTDADGLVNARILDDQWLSSLLELGMLGVFGLVWLLVRAVRLLKDRAKADDSPDGWLATALATAITAYGVGMLTYDAFSFIQVTFLLFIILGLSAAARRILPPLSETAGAASARV